MLETKSLPQSNLMVFAWPLLRNFWKQIRDFPFGWLVGWSGWRYPLLAL